MYLGKEVDELLMSGDFIDRECSICGFKERSDVLLDRWACGLLVYWDEYIVSSALKTFGLRTTPVVFCPKCSDTIEFSKGEWYDG